MDEDFDMFRPQGLCARCLHHPATELWELYSRKFSNGRAYDFRCKCCVIEGKIERAMMYRDRIPALQAALIEAQKECVGYEAAQLHNHPKGEKE